MLRSFHSVGQGAFYTEEFSNFVSVYDCGTDTVIGSGKSSTREKTIKHEIFSVFNKNSKVNVLFISHFHRDHVNGLECLLSRCNVDYVVLPYLQEFSRIELFLESYIGNSRFLNDLILDPVGSLNRASPTTKVIYVHPFEIVSDERQIVQLESLDNGDFVNSNVAIRSSAISSWEYIPCNFDYPSRAALLKSEFKKRNISISNVNDFEVLWKNSRKRKAIKDAYTQLKGNFNATTMTVYSGPYGEHGLEQFVYDSIFGLYHITSCVACLFLGDFEASKNWNDLDRAYNGVWDNIGVIQIPHHGAKENYTSKLNSKPFTYSVISAGLVNSHRHPHSYTTGMILKNKGIMKVVTESPATRLQFFIEPEI
ncbi:hypothetical protein Q9F29_004604 [Vibrio parahaemolyticus]|nr:hypothetical protein [Vibrio parahaemolyticus]OEE97221.1 hypothetical protein A1QM_15230 [Vibrio genomosp. F10 str. 9ZC157]EGQ9537177.1 hypothetical protein [Vibrio parahaemolyticus]EGR0761673.1 hypothetical protein [Vibrio parahaemolyticus]EHZ7340087.1 hypothetical protein [Vibrio parahaemolyticus]